MLTVILRGNGDMIWDWGTTWETEIPNQEYIFKLVKALNSWRLGSGKDYLVYGRMQKPLPFEGATNIPMITRPGKRSIDFPSVFTSNWQSGNGRKSQFFVNYLPGEQEITFNISGIRDVKVFRSASEDEGSPVSGMELILKLEPLSAIMVSYSD
jgi:hypothetical protein